MEVFDGVVSFEISLYANFITCIFKVVTHPLGKNHHNMYVAVPTIVVCYLFVVAVISAMEFDSKSI